jgi:hypothetical protein
VGSPVTPAEQRAALLGGGDCGMTLDAKCEAAVERWVNAAPEFSETQADLIAAVFDGALSPGKKT